MFVAGASLPDWALLAAQEEGAELVSRLNTHLARMATDGTWVVCEAPDSSEGVY